MPTNIPSATLIDLIRHGEPVGGRRYRGQLDDPLSEKGWAQMRAAVRDICPWQVIVSSPLLRCSDFAKELSIRYQLPLQVDARLQEIGFGVWEGKTAAEICAQDPDILQRFIHDPIANRPQGAETLADFRDRVVAGWEQIVHDCRGQHVLIVAHAGVMRMVMRHILDMPLDKIFRIQVDNAVITRIRIDTMNKLSTPRLIFHAGQL